MPVRFTHLAPCHTASMVTKRITLSLPEDLVRRARVLAAQQGTSLSALVADVLDHVIDQDVDYDSVWAAEERLMVEGVGLALGPVTWSGEGAHER